MQAHFLFKAPFSKAVAGASWPGTPDLSGRAADADAANEPEWVVLLSALQGGNEITNDARELLAEIVRRARAAGVAEERERVARDVHDSITQTFIGINMLLSSAQAAGGDAVRRARRLARHGIQESRRVIHALAPTPLMSRPFDQAVRSMASDSISGHMALCVEAAGDWSKLPADRAGELFRIVQEAVNNAVKHSNASRLSIDLSCNEREAVALVADNGRGFRPGKPSDAGFGLASMQQRASCCGGRVDIVSSPGKGTQVFVTVALGPD